MQAVITGDIVGFSGLPEKVQALAIHQLDLVAADLRRAHPALLQGNIDTFRGDGWQLALREPGRALEIALLVRARLRALSSAGASVDTRAAIGIGSVSRLDPERVSRSQGSAFELSGRALDALAGGHRMVIAIDEQAGNRHRAAGLSTALVLLDALVQRWTPRQSRAIAGTLLGRTQKQIGDDWIGGSVSQQAIAQHLEAASWPAVEEAIGYFRECWPEVGPDEGGR